MLMAAAMLALVVLVAAPVLAQNFRSDDGDNRFDRNDDHGFFFGGGDRFNNDGEGVAFELGDVENESGDIETENNFSIEGNNNNACLGQQQFGNTGNFTNQQGVLQSGGGGVFVDDDDNDRDHNWNWWNRDRDHNRNFDRDRDRVFFGGAEADDIEFSGPEVTFAPQNET